MDELDDEDNELGSNAMPSLLKGA